MTWEEVLDGRYQITIKANTATGLDGTIEARDVSRASRPIVFAESVTLQLPLGDTPFDPQMAWAAEAVRVADYLFSKETK